MESRPTKPIGTASGAGTERRLLKIGAPLFLLCYFALFAGGGIGADFSGDDLMNLHGYLQQGIGGVLQGNLFYWSTSYRPLGGLVYLSFYKSFGFDPFPLRLFCYALLIANLWLAYGVTKALSGSGEVGVLATLLITYHAWFVDLYYSSGTVFELLCFGFYFSALLYYGVIRQRSQRLKGWQLVWLSVLYVCALNSKEMAVTLPLFLGVYELLYWPPKWRGKELLRWLQNSGRGAIVTGLLTVPYVVGKLTGEGSLIENPAYRPSFSAGRYLDTFHLYLNPLFYQNDVFRDPNTIQLMIAMLAFALWQKSRALLFAWCFLLLSVLPFIFLPHYSAFFLYIPSVGWALYISVALLILRQSLFRSLRRFVPAAYQSQRQGQWPVTGIAMFLLLAAGLAPAHWAESPRTMQHFQSVQPDVCSMARELRNLQATIPAGSRILFLNDPFPLDYGLLFLVRLLYGDLTLEVGRQKPGAVPPADSDPYDLVLDYLDGHVVRVAGQVVAQLEEQR